MSVFSERYLKIGGKLSKVELKQTIRINTLRTSENAILKRLSNKGIQLSKIQFAKHGFVVDKSPFSIGASLEYLRGYLTPQEAAAQLPVQVLSPKPGEQVLDMAASPGVKTSQISQWMENKGEIFAMERNNLRLPGLKNNLERLGVENCIAFNTDAAKIKDWNLKFDKILIDAPCMGNFMQGRNWVSRHNLDELHKNTPIQKSMLKAAASVVKSGGTIVYSTCSLEPEEDELIIDWALRELPVRCISTGIKVGDEGLTNVFGKNLNKDVGHCRRFWPHKTNTEGFFIAKLVRK